MSSFTLLNTRAASSKKDNVRDNMSRKVIVVCRIASVNYCNRLWSQLQSNIYSVNHLFFPLSQTYCTLHCKFTRSIHFPQYHFQASVTQMDQKVFTPRFQGPQDTFLY